MRSNCESSVLIRRLCSFPRSQQLMRLLRPRKSKTIFERCRFGGPCLFGKCSTITPNPTRTRSPVERGSRFSWTKWRCEGSFPASHVPIGSFAATSAVSQFANFFFLSGPVCEAEHFMGDQLIAHISCATCSFASFHVELPQRFCLSRACSVKLMLFAEIFCEADASR